MNKKPTTVSKASVAKGEPRTPGAKSVIDEAIATLEVRNAHPYDGINGRLPDWMPVPLSHEFNAIRNRLLDSVSMHDLQRWMDLWRSPTDDGWMYVPPEYDRDIDSLVYIQTIANLGPEAGVDAYLGNGGMEVVRGMARLDHNRKAATRPRPDGLHRVILCVLRKLPEGEHAGPYVARRLKELAIAREEVDGVTIEFVNDEEIEWRDRDNPAGTAPLAGLKDRVSRALRQLRKEKLELKNSR
jgi:hypothetical protein